MASYTYSPQGYNLQTGSSGLPGIGTGYGIGLPDMSFFQRMASIALAEKSRERYNAESRQQLADEQAKQDRLKQQQQEDYVENLRRQGPPVKMMEGGPGIIPGYMPDTNAMNAYQRQMFLPQGAHQVGGMGPSQAGLGASPPLQDISRAIAPQQPDDLSLRYFSQFGDVPPWQRQRQQQGGGQQGYYSQG